MNKADDTAPVETHVAPRHGLAQDAFDEDPLALYESEVPFGETSDVPFTSAASSQLHAPSEALQPLMGLEEGGPIPLDQIVDRLGHVAWPEAVSIVQGLCAALSNDLGGGTARIPEMSDTWLTAQGTIVLVGRGAAAEPGPRLARMLHSLIIAGNVPVPLRLFVTKWASIATPHSLSEFSRELAYFARPDGVELVKEVYERAAAIRPVLPKLPGVVQEPEQPPQIPVSAPRVPTRWVVATVAVISVSIATLLIGRAFSGTTPPGPESTTTFGSVPSAAATAAIVDSTNQGGTPPSPPNRPLQTSSALETIQPVSRTSARGVAGQTVAVRAVAGQTSVVRAGAGQTAKPVIQPPRRADVRPGAAALTTPALPSFPDSATSLGASAAASDNLQIGDHGPQSDAEGLSQIYSVDDRDVTPPAMLHPQLPPPLFAGVQEDTNTIELIISEVGTVERVRLLSTPKRMADMMLLSGAKTWEFEPASRQGRSVRYRLLLTWAATP